MTGIRSALVTGATGFIGSALAQRLLAENVEVICLVRAGHGKSPRLAGISGARLIEVPTFQAGELSRALAGLSADVVFNLASYGVRQEDRDPLLLTEGNIGLTTNLLLATARCSLNKFVHAGSCAEYGFPGGDFSPIRESEPLRPASLYGAAKACSTIYGSALASQLDVPFVTLRLFGVFGAGEASHRLIPYLVDRLRRSQSVDLTPGEQVRDLLYIDDVIDAFLAVSGLESPKHCEVYNVCSSHPVSVREIGEAVADALKKPRDLLQWGRRQYRDDEPMWLVGDNHRFRQATSWQPRVSLKNGVERVVAASPIESERYAV
jgi:UDP-glucose 4-epimerase